MLLSGRVTVLTYRLENVWCDDPPTLSAESFLFALVFLNRMSVGGAGRVISEMGRPGVSQDKFTFPPFKEKTLSMQTHCWILVVAVLFVCFGTFQHPS